jgi:hypothetical protein
MEEQYILVFGFFLPTRSSDLGQSIQVREGQAGKPAKSSSIFSENLVCILIPNLNTHFSTSLKVLAPHCLIVDKPNRIVL